MPFYQGVPTADERKASSLLQDVVRPLAAAGLLAAILSSGPFRWRGIALLPLRLKQLAKPGDAYGQEPPNGGGGEKWQNVGDRLRDRRAMRGTYVCLDLRRAPSCPPNQRC